VRLDYIDDVRSSANINAPLMPIALLKRMCKRSQLEKKSLVEQQEQARLKREANLMKIK